MLALTEGQQTRVPLTGHHITHGVPRDCAKCPVALATIDALGGLFLPGSGLEAGPETIWLLGPDPQDVWWAATPQAVEDFINAIDYSGNHGGPFEFTLTWHHDPLAVTS